MRGEGNNRIPSVALLNVWEDVKVALTLLAKTLREEEGCEEAELTLCLRNRSRMDTYCIPYAGTNSPDNSPSRMNLSDGSRQNSDLPSERIGEYSSTAAYCEEILQCLKGYSIKQLRPFFTSVRKTLNLSTFDWPQTAKTQFLTCRTGPVPSAPGRANSGKDALLFMLKLSLQNDEGWRAAVKRALNSEPSGEPEKESNSRGDNDGKRKFKRIEEFIAPLDNATNSFTAIDTNRIDCDVEVEILTPPEALKLAQRLPCDELLVSAPRREWVPLPVLLSLVRYPRVRFDDAWFIQNTPGDGNCMFSAILVAAKSLPYTSLNLDSVQNLRSLLRKELKELSRAGQWGSGYRREWLAACLYDVDNDELQDYSRRTMERALDSFSDRDMETFLAPLRIIVSNWADMVGGDHWGGMLRAELFIFATVCNAVIEVLQPIGNASTGNGSPQAIVEMCDTRNGDCRVTLQRRDLIYPIPAVLASPEQRFLGPISLGDTSSGWVGTFPVMRVVLNHRHYSACTSRSGYSVPPQPITGTLSVANTWFKHSDTLVEPYCSLSTQEKLYYDKAIRLIRTWREGCIQSEEMGRHSDALVMQVRKTDLSVSMLSHLETPYPMNRLHSEARNGFLLSDELITCYMHLLQTRTEMLRRGSDGSYDSQPPKCLYKDSWFFKSISRGLSGPTSKKKKEELLPFSMIMVPSLVDSHWVLGVCYMEERIVAVYDPLGLPRPSVFNVISNWLHAQLPHGEQITWTYKQIEETRCCKQVGATDCGIYICKAAESLGLGIPIRISQVDIPYVRKRMLMEFTRQEASPIRWPR